MKAIIHSIFKTFFLSLCIIGQVHLAYAADQSLIPPGKTTFLDSNGKPLSSGKVYFYVPSTTTPKTTYKDFDGSIPNTQPVTLDAAGRALIWGTGQYRQIVKDKNDNLIWDVETSAAGSGGGTPSTATGDGDLVGTIKPWAGMTAPNQYAFTYGQEINRTTYSALFTAITSNQPVFCTSGSPILTGLGDTSNFWIGMALETSCVAPGFTTIISKTATTVTMATNANVTVNTTAVFFPWGRGNGSTTFNLPDLRGVVLAGNNIMGGIASSRLTVTNFGATNPNSSGAVGGNESIILTRASIPSITPTGTIVSTSTTTAPAVPYTSNIASGAGQSAWFSAGSSGTSSLSPYLSTNTSSTFTGLPQGGGVAVSAIVAAAGSGYINGSQTITVLGGTCTTQPQFTVSVAGNVFTGTPSLLTAGSCTIAPTNPATTSGGGGTGGTLTVVYSANPTSIIQPTITTNYIIKITPDSNSATASGVTSLGLMTGDIACGFGLLCTGNNISVNAASAAGSSTEVQFNDSGALAASSCFVWVSPALTIGLNGTCGGQLKLAGSTSGTLTQQVPAVAGTPTVTWGSSSGTPAVAATSPIQIDTSTGIVSLVVGTQDTVLGYWGSTSASALAINNCANALTYSTATHTFGCNATAGTGTVTQVNTSGLATGGPITATGTVTVTAATKSDQQTGSSTTTAVTPAQQQQHDSAAKGWIYVTQSAGTYTTQKSYNMSFSKTGTGAGTLTFATAFDSANYSLICSVSENSTAVMNTAITNSTTATIGIFASNTVANTDKGFSCHAFGRQ